MSSDVAGSHCVNMLPGINLFNPLWLSDALCQHRSGSTLAQVMVWCRQAPSHYLNQCRCETIHLRAILLFMNLMRKVFGDDTFEITTTSPRSQWVKSCFFFSMKAPASPAHCAICTVYQLADRTKWPTFWKRHSQVCFLEWKLLLHFYQNFTEVCSSVSSWQYVIVGSGHGLGSNT